MSARDFLDTNILVYAYETADARKQNIAQRMMRGALGGEMVISSQVLAELSSVLLYRLSPRMPPNRVATILDALAPVRVIQNDREMTRRAVEVHAAYGIHFYDGLIIAAAERAGCERIWSEDLSPSQKYFGITVANPF
jgi:predicted nucleic acid-binding protein